MGVCMCLVLWNYLHVLANVTNTYNSASELYVVRCVNKSCNVVTADTCKDLQVVTLTTAMYLQVVS